MNAGAILNKLLLHSDPALVLNISTLQTILEDLIVKAKKKTDSIFLLANGSPDNFKSR